MIFIRISMKFGPPPVPMKRPKAHHLQWANSGESIHKHIQHRCLGKLHRDSDFDFKIYFLELEIDDFGLGFQSSLMKNDDLINFSNIWSTNYDS